MTSPRIDPKIISDAQVALDKYIERRRKRRATVKVEQSLYHEGLYNVRCVLVINGQSERMYYRQSMGRWAKARRL